MMTAFSTAFNTEDSLQHIVNHSKIKWKDAMSFQPQTPHNWSMTNDNDCERRAYFKLLNISF